MTIIPLQAVPAQTVSVILGSQSCTISVYQKSVGVFFDLQLNGNTIVSGRVCRDRVKLVRSEYLGLIGDLFFADILGKEDPDYTGLGGRFVLVYLEADEI